MLYLLKNDFFAMIKTLGLFIIIILIELLFGSLLINENKLDIILGRNYNGTIDILSILFFLLNILYFIYISLKVVIKDLLYNLDNIFLRIKPKKFIVEKIFFIAMSILLLRTLQYIILVPTYNCDKLSTLILLGMLSKDILFYSLLSLSAVLFRQLYYKLNNIYMLLIILTIFLIPKDIDKSYMTYIITLIFVIIINIMINNVKSKAIIEKEGENK